MDTNSLVAQARARLDHTAQKRILRERYQTKLTFAFNGGMFRASPEMITFLSLYGDQTIVVEDLYQNPVEVEANLLLEIMQRRYKEQTNAWLNEYHQMQKQR
jgi:hypothetical protein